MYTTVEPEFTYSLRQQAILDYVINHPEANIKERIIEKLTKEGRGSRKTILKDIKELVDYGVLKIHKEKTNSQVHHVIIRNDSILLSVTQDLSILKHAFSALIDIAKQDRWDSYEQLTTRKALRALFQHLTGIYTLYVVFVWPTEVELSERKRLYAIVFETIKEIQIKLAGASPKNIGSEEFEDSVEESFALVPWNLEKTFKDLKEAGLKEYAEAILDPLWKVSLPFVPKALFHPITLASRTSRRKEAKQIPNLADKINDWRNVLKFKHFWYPDPDPDSRGGESK